MKSFLQQHKFKSLLVAAVIVAFLCALLLSRTPTATFGALYEIDPAEITSIDINSYEHYYPFDHEHVYELLSTLKLRPFSYDPPPRPIDHIMYLRLNGGASTYSMSFSAQLDQVFIAESKREANGDYTTTDTWYAILNPEVLTKQDRSHLTTAYLNVEDVLQFRLDADTVSEVHTAVEGETKQAYTDGPDISQLCTLLNSLQISSIRDYDTQAEHCSIHLTTDDQTIVEVFFDEALTTCRIMVSRPVDGEAEYTFISTPHRVDNPELLKDSTYIH